jgi:hypothetical protein
VSRDGSVNETLGSLFVGKVADHDGRAGFCGDRLERVLAATGDDHLVSAFGE